MDPARRTPEPVPASQGIRPRQGVAASLRAPLALLLLLAGAVVAGPSCGPGADSGAPAGAAAPLRVGLEAKYPPFESKTATGTLEGLDVDLARAIGRHLGRDVTFSDMDFDALIPELQAGRLDLVCSAVSRTPERAEQVDFSLPYAKVPMGVLVSVERVPEGKGLAALEGDGVTIAVQRGTSGEKKAAERFPRAKLVQFATEVDAATEVTAGRAHAFVYDVVSVVKLHEKDPGTTRILDLDLGTEEYSIAFPKGSALRSEVDAFLAAERRPGGAVHAVFSRWRAELDRLHVRTE